ncbi:hypothetical protein DFH11DRAFT_1792144 [Phellopilus nigrolimitatus]|nr:hypothetical protein DFH11DRAFT_1792144 [Phellopilus nigrolimitatus]
MEFPKPGNSQHGYSHAWELPSLGTPKFGRSQLGHSQAREIPKIGHPSQSKDIKDKLGGKVIEVRKTDKKERKKNSLSELHKEFDGRALRPRDMLRFDVVLHLPATPGRVYRKLETDFSNFRHGLAVGLAFGTLDLKTSNARIAAEIQRDHRILRLHVARRRRQRELARDRAAPQDEQWLNSTKSAINASIALSALPGALSFAIQSLTSNAPNTLLFRAHSPSVPLTRTLKTADARARAALQPGPRGRVRATADRRRRDPDEQQDSEGSRKAGDANRESGRRIRGRRRCVRWIASRSRCGRCRKPLIARTFITASQPFSRDLILSLSSVFSLSPILLLELGDAALHGGVLRLAFVPGVLGSGAVVEKMDAPPYHSQASFALPAGAEGSACSRAARSRTAPCASSPPYPTQRPATDTDTATVDVRVGYWTPASAGSRGTPPEQMPTSTMHRNTAWASSRRTTDARGVRCAGATCCASNVVLRFPAAPGRTRIKYILKLFILVDITKVGSN